MDDGHGGRGGQRGTWPWAWRVEPAGPESLIAPGFGFDEETQVKVKDDRGAFSRGREAEASLSLALSTSADGAAGESSGTGLEDGERREGQVSAPVPDRARGLGPSRRELPEDLPGAPGGSGWRRR